MRNRIYFTKETENAIVDLNESDDQILKSKIYSEKIEKPLNRLVENIINRFKFPHFKDASIDLQADTVSFLVMQMDKYHQEKGRAFSYFSILAKNYLILGNNEHWKLKKQSHRIDTNASEHAFDIIDELQDIRQNDETPEFVRLMLAYWENNLTNVFSKRQEIQIADAVLTLFRRSVNIENFNKKALYLMIREMTGLRTQYITAVVNKMRVHNDILVKEYNAIGYFDTEMCLDDFT